MTDDIVTRLRAMADQCTHRNRSYYNVPQNIEFYNDFHCQICVSLYLIANEIEQLRIERDQWKEVADGFYKSLDSPDDDDMLIAICNYEIQTRAGDGRD